MGLHTFIGQYPENLLQRYINSLEAAIPKNNDK